MLIRPGSNPETIFIGDVYLGAAVKLFDKCRDPSNERLT